MIGLAKVVAVIGALLAAPVAYVAYSASQNGDNGNHYGQINNGDVLPILSSFIRRVCSGYAPDRGVLRTQLV